MTIESATSINMSTLFEIHAPNHSPLFAACYGYCAENGLSKELIEAEQEGQIIPFCMERDLPVTMGIDTVTTGDWAALTKELEQ